jgi:hypothetical protein
MKNSFLVLILFTASLAQAQINRPPSRFFEVGFLFGLTNYSGDISEQRVELEETRPGYGAFIRHHFGDHFSGKIHFYTGSISGDDRNTSRKERSFRFSTNIVEFAAVGEWNILDKDHYALVPYLFGGIGTTFARAELDYYGTLEKRENYIKDPSEFGVTQKYRFVLAPVGVGVRTSLFDLVQIGVEGGMRPVFSDRLDGASVNANPKSGDWYYFAGATLSFLIGH